MKVIDKLYTDKNKKKSLPLWTCHDFFYDATQIRKKFDNLIFYPFDRS